MNDLIIKPILNQETWEQFLLSQPQASFLQSWHAADLAEDLGETTLRLGIFEKEKLVGVCYLSVVRARRGSYLFAPYGPVFNELKFEYLQALTSYLTTWGREQRIDFIRFSPFWQHNDKTSQILKQAGFRLAPIHMLAEYLWVLDLAGKSEEDLLAGMSKTTRYSVKKAIKENVVVSQSTKKEDVDLFLTLHVKTKDRHQFTPYPDRLFIKQVEHFASSDEVVVFTAKHAGTVIASAIVMYYGNTASYHHGASIPSKIPAAYLVQWRAIQEAKKRGCSLYNFWGITPLEDTKHPFHGISLFKVRFGGRALQLTLAHDKPLTARYWTTVIIETARRIHRGFGWRRT